MQQNGKTENEDFLAEAFTNEPKRENKPEDEEGLPLNQARLFGQRAENRPALALPGLTAMMAFLIALVTDLLTYSYRIGMQWAILVVLLLAGGLILAVLNKKRLPWQSLALSGLAGLLAVLSAVRSEGRTVLGLNLLSLSALVILAITYLNGQWMQYRLREHIIGRVKLIFSGVTAVPAAIINAFKLREDPKAPDAKGRGLLKAVLIGLLIALPFIVLLGTLLAGADEAFSKLLGNFVRWLRFDNLGDIFSQGLFIGVLAWIIFGMYAHAFTESSVTEKIEPDRPLFRAFLGNTEAAVVLGSVNLLFALFLFVQARYFFAGQNAVESLGLTYSSYAVKGFNELIMVACLVFFIHYVLSSITRRVTQRQRRLISALATLMVLQVGVVLTSAHMRLALYEQMYGFTQLRLISHLFIPFIGLVLLASVLMELKRAFKHTAIVLFGTAVAFSLCLAFVNVDATVARLNIQRAVTGEKLDYAYLIHDLSEDATPVMVERWQAAELPSSARADLGAVLACRANLFAGRTGRAQPWWGYDLAEHTARRAYGAYASQWPTLEEDSDGSEDSMPSMTVSIQGETYYCGQKPEGH